MRNLKSHLMIVMSILTTGTVVATAAGVFAVAQSSIQRNLDNAILQLAKTELASATDTGRVHVHVTEPWTLTVQGVPGYEKFVWIEDLQGRVLARTPNVGPRTVVADGEELERRAREGHTAFGNLRIDGRRVRAVLYPFHDQTGEAYVGVVGVPENVVTDSVASIGQIELLIGFTCVLLSCAVAAVVSGSLSRPLADLAERVERADPGDAHGFVPVEGPYREVGILGSAFGRMFARTRASLEERSRTIAAQRRFVADASHELRTPVSNMQGTLEVALRQERAPEAYREAISTSLVECQRMGRLVEDLLTLAKTDEGAFTVQKKREDVGPLVERCAERLLGGDLRVDLQAPSGLFAWIDAGRLAQALDNLCRNARIHAASTVRIEAGEREGWLWIRVANDGPALSPEDATRVFERFTRLDGSRARDTGGSGLGLAIVKAIVDAHGGTVSAGSSDGWTTFELRLPSASS
jgi:two-component system OmpR family sensor kinase